MKNLSTFNPSLRVVEPDDQPDRLAEGVLNSLARPAHRKLSFGIARTFALTAITFGLLPMIFIIRQLRWLIALQEQQYWHLAEWLRLRTADADAIELQKASQKIRFNNPLGLMTWLFVLIAVGAVAMHFTGRIFSLRDLFQFAYRIPTTPEAIIFNIAICSAAACNWAHLAWHQQNIERYLRWFNQLSARQNLHEIELSKLRLIAPPLWIIAGIALTLCGGLWALPVMLAAGAQRRYVRSTSLQVRSEIAQRLRAMLAQQRPTIELPARAAGFVRSCIRPNCRATMPAIANFCPRCGTKVSRTIESVA